MGYSIRCALLSLAVVAVSSSGQESNLGGPVSGLLVDQQSRSIRPILGMPGSAHAGDASVTAFDFASVAPDGRSALIARDGSLYLLRRMDGMTPVWRELRSDSGTISGAGWSEDSESLGIVNATTNRLELWGSLSSDPKQGGTVDITSLTDRVVSVAVGKDASYAFAATQGADDGALYLLSPGSEPRMILPLSRSGGLLLSADALYVTDRGRSEVIRVTNWAENPAVATIASSGNGVSDPVGVVLSADRKTLYVASAGVNQVLGFDVASNAVNATFDLDFQPTRLEHFGTGNLLLLEKGVPGEAPAQVLDSAARKVFFIPVSAAAGE